MNGSGLEYSMNMTGGVSADRLGVTTTVKEQVQNIQAALASFKQATDQQRKSQNELQLQLKKLDDKTHKEFTEMLQEIIARTSQLTDAFRNENERQNKEFQYMEMQSGILTEEHQKLNGVSQDISVRTTEMENRVGV